MMTFNICKEQGKSMKFAFWQQIASFVVLLTVTLKVQDILCYNIISNFSYYISLCLWETVNIQGKQLYLKLENA